MNRTSLAKRFVAAAMLAAAVVACSDTPTAPSSDATTPPPGLRSSEMYSPGLRAALDVGSSPCASRDDGLLPLLNIGAGAVTPQVIHATLGGASTRAFGTNSKGQVVGYSELANGTRHAFLWNPPSMGGPTMIDLGTMINPNTGAPFQNYQANRINENGWVVGSAYDVSGGTLLWRKAFLWKPGGPMVNLGSLGNVRYSEAQDINDAGQIVGYSQTGSNYTATQWTGPGTAASLGFAPGGNISVAYGINANGDVVGTSNATGTSMRAAKAKFGTPGFTILPLVAAGGEFGWDLNASGQVAGYGTSSTGHAIAGRWAPSGTPTALPDLPAPSGLTVDGSFSWAVLASGAQVGYTRYSDGSRLPAYWDVDGTVTNLGKPAGACSGEAWDIAFGSLFAVTSFTTPKASIGCAEQAKVSVTFSAKSIVVAGMASWAGKDSAVTWTVTNGPFHYVISWDDGTVTEGDRAAPGTIEATHDYAAAGTYNVRVVVSDNDGNTVSSDVLTLTKEKCPPSVTVVTTKASYVCDEVAGVTASFTAKPGTGPFAYVIDWGDGSSPSTGSVANAGDIPATHAYPDGGGTYTVTVQVTNAFGETGTATTTVKKVACTVNVTLLAKATIACDEVASATATFTSDATAGAPYSYAISWGDGSTENGTAGAPGSITKTHDYAKAGTYTVSVTVTDKYGNSDTKTASITKQDCTPQVTLVATKASYVCDEAGAVTASFTSSSPNAGPYAYVIEWGDGQKSTGTANAPGDIPASHDYIVGAGTYTVKVTVTNKFGESGSATTTVTKIACSVNVTLVAKPTIACDEAASATATFTSNASAGAPYSYAINWGDGSTENGTAGAPGSITKSHSYASAGTYTVTVTVADKYGNSDTKTASITKQDCTPQVTLVATKASYVCDEAGAVTASFTSSSANAGPYAYVIEWGDGQTSSGTAAAPGDIPASHNYAVGAGTYTVKVTVTNKFGESGSATTTVTKVPCDLKVTSFLASKTSYACNENASVTTTFTSTAISAAPFAYAISWGDGTTTNGSSAAPGSFTQAHAYAAGGSYTVTVTVTDAYGKTDTKTTTVVKQDCVPQITTFLASKTLYACDEAASVSATFTSDADVGPYAWTITWGDGQTSSGSSAAPGTITQGHSYAAYGSYSVKVVVTNARGDKAESTTQVNVDKCKPQISALNITAVTACNESALLTGTFAVTNNPGPFTATIVWGDGQTQTIPVTPGTQFSANHSYGANKSYTVTVTVSDAEGRSDASTVQTVKNCAGAACTYTIGYWKNHTGNWPAGYAAGNSFLSNGSGAVTWLTALSQPTKGNQFWILARQWAGATLNTASGAPVRSDVQQALSDGEAWLKAHLNADGSPKIVGTGSDGDVAVQLGGVLDEFNNGFRGTPHCGDGSDVPPDTPPVIVSFTGTANVSCGQKASVVGSFTADAIDAPWTYTITWGDGSSTTGSGTPGTNIAAGHDYTKNGTFTVTLTVKDKDGDTATKTTTVTVYCPDYDFNITQLTLTSASIKCTDKANVTAAFSGSSANGPFSYSLSWGDGTTNQTGSLAPSTPLNATHSYTVGGSYTITFTVTDRYGKSITKKELITVTCSSTKGCTLTHGYWKNHPEAWPTGYDPAGKFLSTGPKAITWLASMSTPPSGNNFYVLSQQWSAAKLNGAKGAYIAPEVATAITQGEALLRKYIGSNGSVGTITSTTADGAEAVRISKILDDYNNGLKGTPHCD